MKPTNTQIPYPLEELMDIGKPKVYKGRQLDEIAFPIGGIGTGSISIGGWGQLRDFEIFNRPNKGLMFNYSFFTLYAREAGKDPVTKVVQGPVGGVNFTGSGSGVTRLDGSGLPHFRHVEFIGAFPFARLNFDDPDMPLDVSLEAYNPFIPLNPDDSGLPIAVFLFHLTNPGENPVETKLYGNLENKTGFPDVGQGRIECFDTGIVRGLRMSTKKHAPDSPRYGTLTLSTTHDEIVAQTHWFRGGWFDSLHRFWDQVSQDEFEEIREPAEMENGTDVGSIGLKAVVQPGESITLPIFITWHTPNFEKYWGHPDSRAVWKNYYATQHEDALAVAEYFAENQSRLESETRQFADALFSSSLPTAVLDAVSSQISILKSTTCIRLEDGTFYGWEGCHPSSGCCEGTCTHVWNYAQAMPFLFPSLERSIRTADYKINLHEDGHMTFRMPLPLGVKPGAGFHAAADGQMGGIMKVYREWLISGDDDWLKSIWQDVKRALEYAWKCWDKDKDGVMEGVQHNTYDIEFYGPNTMMGSFYLGALRAAEKMATYLGEHEKAKEYHDLFVSGSKKMMEELFNGEFYVQDVRLEDGKSLKPSDPNYPKYQYGEGCLSDQMIGQWYARILKLGDLFDPESVRKTMSSVFKYNWRSDLSNHANPQRIYALNDEAGLLLCSWPHGGRPMLPFVYCDEVWCGIEYQVASHLIYEGLVEEGLAIVKGVRDRHDGTRRNPWNEFECGNHYARSMASYSVLLALSDFFYSAPDRLISFAPRIHESDFRCFFSVQAGWGVISQKLGDQENVASVELRSGKLELDQIKLGFAVSDPVVTVGDEQMDVELSDDGSTVKFARTVTITPGSTLVIKSQGSGR